MNEVELEKIIVRLVGDPSQLIKSLDTSVKATTEAANQIQQSAKQIEGFTKKVESYGKTLASALGFVGLGTSLKSAFDQFSDFEARGERFRELVREG